MKINFSKNSAQSSSLLGLIRVSIIAMLVMITIIGATKLIGAAKTMILG
ncbi:MAG TPA: hypothetical protein VF692_05155 [Pyrinomonadaceae bacterium]|jgi:hypothetical protein